jgi:hypothetical protein
MTVAEAVPPSTTWKAPLVRVVEVAFANMLMYWWPPPSITVADADPPPVTNCPLETVAAPSITCHAPS